MHSRSPLGGGGESSGRKEFSNKDNI